MWHGAQGRHVERAATVVDPADSVLVATVPVVGCHARQRGRSLPGHLNAGLTALEKMDLVE